MKKVTYSRTVGSKHVYWGFTPDAKTGHYKGHNSREWCVGGFYLGWY